MGDLYQYTDYREYLRDWYNSAKEKSPVMSYRYMAKKISIDPGFLVHILQGDKHLSEKHILPLAQLMQLNKRDSKYFERLCLFGKARTQTEISRRFQELMELRTMQSKTMARKQYQYYDKWYIPVVRCAIAARGFQGDYALLAKSLEPEIQESEAMEAVSTLEKLGMLKKHRSGEYEVLDSLVTTGDAWTSMIIRGFQQQTLELAKRALMVIPKEQREISTMTIAVPSQEFPLIQEMAKDFRQKMFRWALEQPSADSVIQLNLQVFTVVKP